MAKKTKKEAADSILRAETLEVQVQAIANTDAEFEKRQRLNEFVRQVEAFIKDQRDVLLVGAKIK